MGSRSPLAAIQRPLVAVRDNLSRAWSALRSLPSQGREKSAPPGGYTASWGYGPTFSDAWQFRRAPSPAQLVEAYKSLIYTCVNLNANAVARTPLRLFAVTQLGQARPKCAVKAIDRKTCKRLSRLEYATKTVANAEQVEEVTEHPLLDTLLHSDTDLDLNQLIQFTAMSLDVVGSAFWWPAPGRFGLPAEFWALPAHLVWPVFDAGEMVPSAYEFGGVRYPKDTLVRFRRLSMKNPYGMGYSPAQAAIEYARLEDTFVAIQDNMLSNGPRPSLLVSHKDPKGSFGQAERERLRNELNRRARGGRAGEVVVVDGPASIEPIDYKPTDLAGLNISQYDMERVANCFDIPISMLKTESSNRAVAEAGLEQHARNAIAPRQRIIASTLTRWTRSLDRNGSRGFHRLFWAFDEVVIEDKQAEAELHKTYIDLGVISRNEARLECGYEAVEGGDELLVAENLAPLAQIASRPKQADERGHSALEVDEDDKDERTEGASDIGDQGQNDGDIASKT